MERNYVGDQMVVCAAGNVDHDTLVDIAADRFHGLKPNGAPIPEKAKYVGGESRVLSDHEQAHIVLGFEGRAYNSDGFYAAQILASILGGGMSSRLFQEVREKRGLCYSVYAFHWAFADSGIFGVAASTGEEEVTDLIPVVLDELLKATETITDDEVLRVRNQIRAGLLMSLESPSSRAGQLARQQILWGRPIPLQETVDRINRITADRVKQIARQVLERGHVLARGHRSGGKAPRLRRHRLAPEALMVMLGWFAPDPTPVLEGPRVVLRAPRPRDYDAWRALRRKSRDFLKPFEPRWTEADLNRQAFARAPLARPAGSAARHRLFVPDLREDDQRARCWSAASPSPTCAAAPPSSRTLGYWMGEEFAGRGLMTEAVGGPAALCLRHPRRCTACRPPSCPTMQASRRVLEKNGFREEGYAENYLQIDGRWADHVLFALTRERWDARPGPSGPECLSQWGNPVT